MKKPEFPDVRGWATLGMFLLVFYVFGLIAFRPELSNNELFKTAVILVLGTGGFGLVCAFLWGGSKASNAASEAVNEIAKAQTTQAPGSTTIAAPATVTVETKE